MFYQRQSETRDAAITNSSLFWLSDLGCKGYVNQGWFEYIIQRIHIDILITADTDLLLLLLLY